MEIRSIWIIVPSIFAVGALWIAFHSQPESTLAEGTVRVVRGRATPQQAPLRELIAIGGASDHGSMQLAGKVKDVEVAILRDYPVVKDVGVQCDAQACFIVGHLNDIPNEQVAQSFDTLVDSSLSAILARSDLKTTGPVIIDTMGGLNIGFRRELVRP